jgi:hypothetical protein
MNEFIPPKKQKPNPLPYMLLVGLLIGIVISWIMFSAPSSSESLPITQTPRDREDHS